MNNLRHIAGKKNIYVFETKVFGKNTDDIDIELNRHLACHARKSILCIFDRQSLDKIHDHGIFSESCFSRDMIGILYWNGHMIFVTESPDDYIYEGLILSIINNKMYTKSYI